MTVNKQDQDMFQSRGRDLLIGKEARQRVRLGSDKFQSRGRDLLIGKP